MPAGSFLKYYFVHFLRLLDLQTRSFHGSKQFEHQSGCSLGVSLIWVNFVCNIGFLREEHTTKFVTVRKIVHVQMTSGTRGIRLGQSELPRLIPRNSVEPDHECTSRIYFDNACNNVTLTLDNVTLTSQSPLTQ